MSEQKWVWSQDPALLSFCVCVGLCTGPGIEVIVIVDIPGRGPPVGPLAGGAGGGFVGGAGRN